MTTNAYRILLVTAWIFQCAKADGGFSDANWVSLSGLPGTSGSVLAIAANTNKGVLYIGGQFTAAGTELVTNVLAWNGTNWLALGSGINGAVSALVLDAAGALYAGGQFTVAGGVGATNIAKWDG